MKYELLPHQHEAISAIEQCFNNEDEAKSAIVSIPTGGGKTFTAVYWLDQVLANKKRKIIWMAQSFELLNQAYECMTLNFSECHTIECVSSNKMHSNASNITNAVDILIITSQTAISNYKNQDSSFYKYVQHHINNLIIILDEAHHAPALGFRNFIMDIKADSLNLWLLGLTATPTYTDKNRRGWLWKIFDSGIIYDVGRELLQKQRILAKENYIFRRTPHKIILSDNDFELLAKKHQDIPEHIIEEMASNQQRNDFIISEYATNVDTYGKTIIFLDRWYQCEYFKEKLLELGISCDAIYYQNTNQERTNKQIIDEFRANTFKVLLNVRMLTEGADIPNIQSVFITRETTSHILLNQMIGRALRGQRAGGEKDVANVILFGDNWDKSVAWATPEVSGGLDDSRIKSFNYPVQQISVALVSLLAKALSFNLTFLPDFSDCIPCGWYNIEYIMYSYLENEQIQLVKEVVLVYESNKNSYCALISQLSHPEYEFDDKWKSEKNNDVELIDEAMGLYAKYFQSQQSGRQEVINNIIKIGRHIAQGATIPSYTSNVLVPSLDMDSIVDKVLPLTAVEQYAFLLTEYSKIGSLWGELYNTFYYFKTAVDMYVNKRLSNTPSSANSRTVSSSDVDILGSTTSLNEKEIQTIVKNRDGNKCLCCGLTSKETKLVVTKIHDIPSLFTTNNLQTICLRCKKSNINNTSYLNTVTALALPNAIRFCNLNVKDSKNISKIKSAIRFTVNSIYDCSAVCEINLSRRKKSEYYTSCEIILHKGNPHRWLSEQNETLLHYFHSSLKQSQILLVNIKII